jgi:uncharacterized membrane protein
MEIKKAVTINKPAEELYRYWRRLDTLPSFMKELQSVTVSDEKRARWASKDGEADIYEWETEITRDQINERIAWRSVTGEVRQEGDVTFKKAPGDRGTEVRVVMRYEPPGGKLEAITKKLFGEDPATRVYEDLRRFKALMETGEIPTIQGQPTGPV